MSWLYSRALAAEYSAACCSAGALSAPSSATPTPQAYSYQGKMTGFSRLSRFGMTSEPLTEDDGEALLTWYLAASRVRTYPRPEPEPELTASNPASGGKWQESSVRYDLVSCSWKTHQCLFDEDLPESSVILPRWGLMHGGLVYQPRNAERRTSATGSGYWPTATTCGVDNGSNSRKAAQARGMWPTPMASDAKSPGDTKKHKKLSNAVRRFPTPTATMAKGWSKNLNRADKNDRLDYTIERKSSKAGKTGRLNPTWTEWLIGWPEEWTDLKPLAMDRFHEWRRRHGRC